MWQEVGGVMSNTVNILGTEYKFFYDDLNNPELAESDGICKLLDKQIIVRDKQYQPGDSDKAKQTRLEHVIRHEVIHAVAEECGVQYGNNEDLVDWIAHIIPVVNKAVSDIGNMEKRTESSLVERLGL